MIISFLVEFPMSYINNRGSIVQLYKGQKNFHLNCSASGYPRLRVTWKRKDIEISLNSSPNTHVYQKKSRTPPRHASSQLYFEEVYCHDTGEYTCESTIEGHDYVDADYVRVEVICKYKRLNLYAFFHLPKSMEDSTLDPIGESIFYE